MQQPRKPSLKLTLPTPLPKPLTDSPIPPQYIDQNDDLALGIHFHEIARYDWSAYYFSIAASNGDPTGMFLYAISMRHGWGMPKDEELSFVLLSQCTDMYKDLLGNNSNIPTHLPLALYETAMSFQQGWGTEKDLAKGAYYFQLASKLGDADAQVALAECFLRGDGVKPSKKEAAKWFRMAEKQGAGLVQMQWIWKEKYDE